MFFCTYILFNHALKAAAPVGVWSQINRPIFIITVKQKTSRNSCFLDLWRIVSWAMSAPGHPQASAKKCKVLSGVRHAPLFAADLSCA